MPPLPLAAFEIRLNKRGRRWRWQVCTADGQVVMSGADVRKAAASYGANRALFTLLLSSSYLYLRSHRDSSELPHPARAGSASNAPLRGVRTFY